VKLQLDATSSKHALFAALVDCCCVAHALCCAVQDKVQDLLSQQLDAADNESVLQELQQLEDLALQEEMQHMPSVPKTEPQQAQQQQQVQPAAEAAGAQAAVQLEEELPSVPKTKVCVRTWPAVWRCCCSCWCGMR
jgi:hypothetical protein